MNLPRIAPQREDRQVSSRRPRTHVGLKKSHAPALSSSLALCARPRVHAKMEAMGLVEVGLPFWYSRQCRVTVPVAGQNKGSQISITIGTEGQELVEVVQEQGSSYA
jgi:hypothetical protein